MRRHRLFDTYIVPFGEERVLVHSRTTGITKILSSLQAQDLLRCKSFETLHQHAVQRPQKSSMNVKRHEGTSFFRRLVQGILFNGVRHGTLTKRTVQDVESAQHQLLQFVEEGFLVSDADIYATILKLGARAASADAPPSITSVGIPTRNRTNALQRALESYINNTKHYDRAPRFIVVDDAEAPTMMAQNRQMLQALSRQHDVDLCYMDRPGRARYAEQLARHAGLPPSLVRFAVLGDERCRSSYGGCRNALLLETVGEVTMQVDDDTVCRVGVSPGWGSGLALTSKYDANEYWFYGDRAAAMAAVGFVEVDFLGIHERLLGQALAHCVSAAGGEIHFDDISSILLDGLESPEARVACSSIGVVGDSGMNVTQFPLSLEGNSFKRLVESQEAYQRNTRTRQLVRAPLQTTISDGMFCMTMNIGLDNRTVLPPFMPVQRNEDGVFGAVMRTCVHEAYVGYLPYMLLHDPPEQRAATPFTLAFRTNDVLRLMVHSMYSELNNASSEHNVQALGRYLRYLASLPPQRFKKFVDDLCFKAVSRSISSAEQRLEENNEAPDYWRSDVRRYITSAREAIVDERLVPSDLSGGADERRLLFQELAGQFSSLLLHWPTIVEAARDLHRNQAHMASQIQPTRLRRPSCEEPQTARTLHPDEAP